jgi:hypothetical protein
MPDNSDFTTKEHHMNIELSKEELALAISALHYGHSAMLDHADAAAARKSPAGIKGYWAKADGMQNLRERLIRKAA